MPSELLNDRGIRTSSLTFKGLTNDLRLFKSKPKKTQNYSELKEACRKEKKVFQDDQFKCEANSISRYVSYEGIEWMRPKGIAKTAGIVARLVQTDGPNHPKPQRILQGKLKDCWFISACFVLAEFPSLWEVELDGAEIGIYRFWFWVFGEWTEVAVDDQLPTKEGKLIFCRGISTDAGMEFWGSLLEKAYAKLNGCYHALQKGNLTDALSDLTGCAAECQNLKAMGFSARDTSTPGTSVTPVNAEQALAVTVPWRRALHQKGVQTSHGSSSAERIVEVPSSDDENSGNAKSCSKYEARNQNDETMAIPVGIQNKPASVPRLEAEDGQRISSAEPLANPAASSDEESGKDDSHGNALLENNVSGEVEQGNTETLENDAAAELKPDSAASKKQRDINLFQLLKDHKKVAEKKAMELLEKQKKATEELAKVYESRLGKLIERCKKQTEAFERKAAETLELEKGALGRQTAIFDLISRELHFNSLICAVIEGSGGQINDLITDHVYAVTNLKKVTLIAPKSAAPSEQVLTHLSGDDKKKLVSNEQDKKTIGLHINKILGLSKSDESRLKSLGKEHGQRDSSSSEEEAGSFFNRETNVPAVNKKSIGPQINNFLGWDKTDEIRLIRLQNPYGEKEWKGAFSDGSKEWDRISEDTKKTLGIKDQDDGEFWMSFDDFCNEFDKVAVCRYVYNSLLGSLITGGAKCWSEKTFSGEWNKKADNCGGSYKYIESFFKNPQYCFDVREIDEQVIISLSQKDNRSTSELDPKRTAYESIGFFVMRVEIKRTTRVSHLKEKGKALQAEYMKDRTVTLRSTMQPGRYCVIPTTHEPDQPGKFRLHILSSNDCNAKEMGSMSDVILKGMPQSKGLGKLLAKTKSKDKPDVITVNIKSVAGLAKSGRKPRPGAKRSLPDPYVELECEGETAKTHTIWNNVDPVFNQMALFHRKSRSSPLNIKVMNYNTIKHSFLGKCVMTLGENNQHATEVEYTCALLTEGPIQEPTGATLTVVVTTYEDLNAADSTAYELDDQTVA